MVPPAGVTVNDPSVPALQVALVVPVMLEESATGSVMVAVTVAVQPLASVTVTVCIPAARLPFDTAVPPPLHA